MIMTSSKMRERKSERRGGKGKSEEKESEKMRERGEETR